MRHIGHLDNERHAAAFSDYLYTQGVDNEVERERDGTFTLWIHEEEQVDAAREMLSRFRREPEHDDYLKAGELAREKLERQRKVEETAKSRSFDSGRLWPRPSAWRSAPFTVTLIATSIAVTLFSDFGVNKQSVMGLFTTQFQHAGGYISWVKGLPEIRSGEVWRILTPMFVHFGLMHILFNMLWLWDLGNMVEARKGTRLFGMLVFVSAGLSNIGQYLVSGPNFGGMSGVVYALLGYVWMKGKFDPRSGLYLHQTTVAMMIIWFFVCLSGLVGNIANMAHGVGLAVGMAWGYLSPRGR